MPEDSDEEHGHWNQKDEQGQQQYERKRGDYRPRGRGYRGVNRRGYRGGRGGRGGF